MSQLHVDQPTIVYIKLEHNTLQFNTTLCTAAATGCNVYCINCTRCVHHNPTFKENVVFSLAIFFLSFFATHLQRKKSEAKDEFE